MSAHHIPEQMSKSSESKCLVVRLEQGGEGRGGEWREGRGEEWRGVEGRGEEWSGGERRGKGMATLHLAGAGVGSTHLIVIHE